MGKQRENKNGGNRGDNAKILKNAQLFKFNTLCVSVRVKQQERVDTSFCCV